MNIRIILFLTLGIIVLICIGYMGIWIPHQNIPVSSSTPLPIPSSISSLPNYDHIVVVLLENKSQDDILGSPKAPFLNSLAKQNSLARNYFATTHPSLPNYISIIGGETFGIKSDCNDCFINARNLTDSLESANKTWKGYLEDMPNSCFIGNKYPYAQKHNPFIYFDDIRKNPNRCQKIVSLDNLSNDLASPQTATNFIWITPNLCHDMHDCSIQEGDTWLSKEIPGVLDSPIFKNQNSLLIITWDEGEANDNKISTILVGKNIKQNYTSQIKYNHYSLLHTIESIWNLPTLTENDKNAPIMSDFFN